MTGVDKDLATLRDYGRLAPRGSRVYAAALARVEAEIARLKQELDWHRSQHDMLRDGWPDGLAERAEAAEAEVARLRDGLRWYAERRNYVPAAPPAVPPPKHLMDTDAWDGGGPGARARALLAEDGAA